MPLNNYSLLKGRPTNNRLATGKNPHYQVLISANGTMFRIAINVQSADGSEVQFLVRSRFEHPITSELESFTEGLHKLNSAPGGVALDYIRSNLMQPWELVPLPPSKVGPDNDLNEKIDAYIQRAMSDENAYIYAFGEAWGPEPQKADTYFAFLPGRGIHDIHMNQGNPPGKYAADNGSYQDGGLLIEFPDENQWVAIFLKFQSQAWHSDDLTAIPNVPHNRDFKTEPHTPVGRDNIPTMDVPDGLIRIVGALVNDIKSPEVETVTLLNTSDLAIDLSGWALKDRNKSEKLLTGNIPAGGTRVFEVRPELALSNKGGIITLVNEKGIKVHGVSYTREQARQPGRTIPFQS